MFFETFSVLEWIFDNLFTKRKPKFPRFDSGVIIEAILKKSKLRYYATFSFWKKQNMFELY